MRANALSELWRNERGSMKSGKLTWTAKSTAFDTEVAKSPT